LYHQDPLSNPSEIWHRYFVLPCVSPDETSDLPLPDGIAESRPNSKGDNSRVKANATVLVAKESFLCCLGTETHMDCFVYTPEMEGKAFISSETSVLASQQTDSSCNLQCWTKGNLEKLFCTLELYNKTSYLNGDLKINLLYSLSDSSLENTSTSSLKDTFMVTQCNDLEPEKYECHIPSVKLNSTYLMWLKITNGTVLLQSPLMSVKPINIVKPGPPLHLQVEMTDKGQLKISWSSPAQIPYPLQYEVKLSVNSTQNVWQVNTFLITDNLLLDSTYLIQVRCKSLHGPGIWSDWSVTYNLNPQEVMYFPPKILTSIGSNVSFYCIYKNKNKIISSKKIVWWLNLAKEIPESQYTAVNDYIGKVTLVNLTITKPGGNFLFNALHCCNENKECNHRYAELYIVDVSINITCETHGNLQKMTCRWSASRDPLLEESTLQLRYYRNDVYCTDFPKATPNSEVKDCYLQRDHSYECTFQPFYLLSGYTMWIEIKHQLGTLNSPPMCIIPKEVVKPFAPSNLKAEITEEIGLLNVSWSNPKLPKSELRFQIRCAVNRTEITWQVISDCSASIAVPEPCVVYVAEVRCSVVDGVGYWSDWSRPAYSVVKDIKGQIYFYLHSEVCSLMKSNLDCYLLQPLMKNLSLCSVLEYVVEHCTSENVTWSDYVGNDTTYVFPWIEEAHTVKVVAINSIGASSMNFNLTLSQQMSRVNIVQSLSAYPVNSNCVIVSWMLSHSIPVITSFVVEWKTLNEEDQAKWMHVSSNVSKCYIYDHFILIEKYQFSLYPIFPEGVGKPMTTDEFSKGGNEKQNDASLYVILPLVISCSVLLFGALLVLHQRYAIHFHLQYFEMNPEAKTCAWFIGALYDHPETFEHLFLKQPAAVSFGPLLLEPEIVFEDISVDKALKKEDKQDLVAVHSMSTKIHDSEHDLACSSSRFNSNSLSESLHNGKASEGITQQSNIKYATIISHSKSSGVYEQPADVSSSFHGCLLGEGSLVKTPFPSSSWEMGNRAFIILPDCHPNKTLAHSVISSEGFSEPSDQEEDSPQRRLYYLGLSLGNRNENDIFLTENSSLMCQLHTTGLFQGMGFLQDMTSEINPFIKTSLKYQTSLNTLMPYMPQFQTPSMKVQETTENKT
uniref:Leptin receptor n=1 Tax=Sphenodon punctatus TaxID=8508 RepID=A0A8D0HBY0_SPHPU